MLIGAVTAMLGAHVRSHLERLSSQLTVPAEVAAQYYVSALLGLLTWWLNGERLYSPDKMDAMFW